MASSPTGNWDRVRQAFADQFEQDGTSFVYRRSQKGEAIRVSAEERSRFIDEFNRNLRRAVWIIYAGMALVFGGLILVSVLQGFDLPEAAVFAAIILIMIPYMAYYRWAWGVPTRELAGRTPIAGERSPDEVRRLRFQRMTYGQLAIAAGAGLVFPFLASGHRDVLSGWNRLWLMFGGALVLLAAVQAFRKWRFEQQDSLRNVIAAPSGWSTSDLTKDPTPPAKNPVWRYVPLAIILLGAAFIAYTPIGKELTKQPSFWPILMMGFGGWALFTVAQGFTKGRIEPLARGFYNTYERGIQPKRFWASMAWNFVFGCFCLWLAFMMNRDTAVQSVRDRCSNQNRKYSPQEVVLACDKILEGKVAGQSLTTADAYLDRGTAHFNLNESKSAIDDYTEALRAQPGYFEAYFDRALANEQRRDDRHAIADYSAAIQVRPEVDAYLNRGRVYGRTGDLQGAVADFNEVVRLKPQSAKGYFYRAFAYREMGDTNRATNDFDTAFRLDPSLLKLLRPQ